MSPAQQRRIAIRWARSHGLELKAAASWPVHDYIHARLGLGTNCEGIVLAVEMMFGFGGPALWADMRCDTPETFTRAARVLSVLFGVDATDTFTDERALVAYDAALKYAPEFEALRSYVPCIPTSNTVS